MSEPTDAVVTECRLDAPPETVWRALTEPHLVAEWLGPNDLRAEPGARFALDLDRPGEAPLDGKVLDADPPHRLAYAWREAGEGAAIESVVTFELTPTERGGTHLRIVHRGREARATGIVASRCPHARRAVARLPTRRVVAQRRLAA